MKAKQYILLFMVSVFILNNYGKDLMWGTWVPYWKVESGTKSVVNHINYFQQVSPFSYEVNKDGILIDKFNKKKALWDEVYRACKKNKVSLIPTVFWAKTQEIHDCLSDTKKCYQQIEDIVSLVNKNSFDGINIDYECVSPNDRDYFITFMQMLSDKLHRNKKILACSIGAQVSDSATGIHPWKPINKLIKPVEQNKKIIKNTTHPLAQKIINKMSLRDYQKKLALVCDQIHLMAYDEWGAPCIYNSSHLKNKYYLSHSSNQWVEKIIKYALSYIPANKLILCIPTYGLEFKILHTQIGRNKELQFAKSRSLGWSNAVELAKEKKQIPKRTAGGELAFTYQDKDSLKYVCFLDQKALLDKAKLANKYKLKGIYLFKIDGTEPTELWPVLKSK